MTLKRDEQRKRIEKYLEGWQENIVGTYLKANAIDLILAEIKYARTELLDDLKNELREYYKKYPDANQHDIIGYIVGFQKRPEAIKKQKENQ